MSSASGPQGPARGRGIDLGARVRWEDDAQGKVFVFDCSNNSVEEAYALFYAFQDALKEAAPGSVRVLGNFTNAHHELELTRMWKEDWPNHHRQIRKFAAFGVGASMKVVFAIYRYYAQFRGSDVDSRLRLFNDESAAKAWLVES